MVVYASAFEVFKWIAGFRSTSSSSEWSSGTGAGLEADAAVASLIAGRGDSLRSDSELNDP